MIDDYVPLPKCVEFHNSHAPIRLVRSGNRAGSSFACAAEVALAATKIQLDWYTGTYPSDPRIAVVGRDWMHTIRLMGRILLDMLGMRHVIAVHWEDQSEEWPKRIKTPRAKIEFLHDSSELSTLGGQFDLIWLDQDVPLVESWLNYAKADMQRRWKQTPVIWSYSLCPSKRNPFGACKEFVALSEKADGVNVFETVLSTFDNPHLNAGDVALFAAAVGEDRQAQITGEACVAVQ